MQWMFVLLTPLIAPDFAPFLIVAAFTGFLTAIVVQVGNARLPGGGNTTRNGYEITSGSCLN
jgi:hypothetical protein